MRDMARRRIASCAALALAVGCEAYAGAEPAGFAAQALQETAAPVRPGSPGGQPFWNGQAVQFLYAPAFDFKAVPGAASYRLTIIPAVGEALGFTAEKPWAPLSPVWTNVPAGPATVTVAGLDARGAPVGEAQSRVFHRAAPFGGAGARPSRTWRESARVALGALVHAQGLGCWFTSGEPDPQTDLYRYPSKIVGAAAAALAEYAAQQPQPADAADARAASRRAADYLLGLHFPAGAAWAGHPPTYHPSLYRAKLKGHMAPGRYMTLCGAETGLYYLTVYGVTKEAKYLEAAVRIAETYARRQLPEGSWLLFVDAQSGAALADNVLVPTLVVEFLDRLERAAGDARFNAVRDKAAAWIEGNPAKTWNWQGQFEDVKPLPPYENLTKHDACDFAIHLFASAPQDPARLALALDLLRFSEDQFVIWSQPPAASPGRQSADGKANAKSASWLLPCALEQYRCYAPVCASSAKLIRAYLAAYRATGGRLHLEKAKALAATLTRTQDSKTAPGRYQTWVKQPSGPMWFNCELLAVLAMEELAAADPDARDGR